MTGKLVVLEGLDGCGKGEQLRRLAALFGGRRAGEISGTRELSFAGRKVVLTREPGGTSFAEHMRATIFANKDLSGRTQLFNFFAARSDHWERVIVPSLKLGHLVISDRADASTFAFQLYGQEDKRLEEFFWSARKFVYGIYLPSRYLFLDASAAECQRRLAAAKGREVTHFDERDLSFHERVRAGYKAYAALVSEMKVLDGEKSIEEVHAAIVSEIDQLLAP